MKKYISILMLLFSFVCTACDRNIKPEQNVQPTPQIKATPDPKEEIMTQLRNAVHSFDLNDYFYYGCEEDFSAAGLNVFITNFCLEDENYESFNINISRGENTIVFPVKAELLYSNFTQDYTQNHELQWGNINITKEDIILTKYDFDNSYSVVERYDLSTLQHEATIKLDRTPQTRLLNTTVYKDGYISQYFETIDDKGLLLIDEKGNVIQKIGSSGYGVFYGYETSDSWNFPYNLESESIEVLTDDMVLIGNSEMFNIPRGLYTDVIVQCQYEEKDKEFVLYRNNGNTDVLGNYIAVLRKNGEENQCFINKYANIHEGFAQENSDYKPVEYSFSNNGRTVTVACDATQLTLTADFDRKTLTEKYNITEDRLGFEYETSSDGRITLWSGAATGGGDYWVSALIAKDNTTGQLKYLDCPGGMYGGGSDFGFLKNGDIYIFGRKEFTVFSSDLNVEKPIFRMSDRFSLGQVNERNIESRYLFAVRRDPQTFGYTVVYADVPYNDGLRYPELGESFAGCMNYTYKIALLDSSGKRYKHIKTGIDVKYSPFGYMHMDMYQQRDNLMHITTWVKSPENIFDEFTVDISTGKIVNLMKEKYEDEVINSAKAIINDAADFACSFRNGSIADMNKPLADIDAKYSDDNYYALKAEYSTLDLLKEKVHCFYSQSFAEYNIYPEFRAYGTSNVPYLKQYRGTLYCDLNLCQRTEEKIYDLDSIKLEISGSVKYFV